uniref:Si:dkey-261h17.1 n=1 Tax=Echeneis naucrates TaxID=173247 RepID=A0A665V1U4_ECHNA
MAASMWRMNGLWRRTAGVLVLCALLLSGEYSLQLSIIGSSSFKTLIHSSSGSSVFAGILVTGLLAALAITIGYFKCQRRPDPKGVRLAEEAYPVDQDNQANTLVSVAPLNPPPETPEKPSVNGESTEAAKTPSPPPTNGHSTTKTADTEL